MKVETENHDLPAWLVKSHRFVSKYFVEGVNALVIIASATAGVVGMSHPTVAIWCLVTVIVFAIVAIVVERRKPSVVDLKQQLITVRKLRNADQKAIQSSMEILMKHICADLGIDKQTDRMSLYYYVGGTFVMLARYSRNPMYSLPGRNRYPADQGVIGQAWSDRQGIRLVRNLPVDREKWLQKMTSSGLSADEAKGLAMQSCEIGALRIEVHGRSVGMIVLETADRGRLKVETLEHLEELKLYASLREFVNSHAQVTPRGQKFGGLGRGEGLKEAWKPILGEDTLQNQ